MEKNNSSEKLNKLNLSTPDPTIQPFLNREDDFGVDVIQSKTKGSPALRNQIFAAAICTFLNLLTGISIGFTGVTLPSIEKELNFTTNELSWFSSSIGLGAIFGSSFSSYCMVVFGQRKCLLMCLPIGILAWISMSTFKNIWYLILSRIIQGIGLGILTGCVVNYVAEISHTSVRGSLFAVNDLSRQFGFLLIFVVGSTPLNWRDTALICGITPAAVAFVGFLFLPDSPRWLALRGKVDEARKAMKFYRGEKYDIDEEINSILVQLKNANSHKRNPINLIFQKTYRIRMLLLSIMMICFHFTGNFVIMTYSVTIFQSVNSSIDPYTCTMIIGSLRVVGTLIYLILVSRIGRKLLLVIPSVIAGFCLLTFGTVSYLEEYGTDITSFNWVPVVSLLLFSMFSSICNPAIILVRSELLPTSIRAVAIGFLNFLFFSASFFAALSYPYMVRTLGIHWVFWFYGLNMFFMALLEGCFIPETRNKSLEEIEQSIYGKYQSK